MSQIIGNLPQGGTGNWQIYRSNGTTCFCTSVVLFIGCR